MLWANEATTVSFWEIVRRTVPRRRVVLSLAAIIESSI